MKLQEGTEREKVLELTFSEHLYVSGICFINSPPYSSEVNIMIPFFIDKKWRHREVG